MDKVRSKKMYDMFTKILEEEVGPKFDDSREAFDKLVASHVFKDNADAFQLFKTSIRVMRTQYTTAFTHGYMSSFVYGNCSPNSDLIVKGYKGEK